MVGKTDLIPIIGNKNPERKADIIFVHGLGGDAWSTWHPYESKDDNHFWLRWLGEGLPDVGIWSLAYQVEPFKKDGHTMSLKNRATNVLSLLNTKKIGERPVLFITHSMGGLLVKQMLRNIYDFAQPEWKKIGEQIRGIVFISTPHSGSDIATWLDFMGAMLGTSESVKELKANNPFLKELNKYFRQHHDLARIPIQVFFETKKTSREQKILGFPKTFAAIVVDEASANPEMTGVVPIPLDEDHLSICRPRSKNSQIYVEVKQFIEKCLSNYNENIHGNYIQENKSPMSSSQKFRIQQELDDLEEEREVIYNQYRGTIEERQRLRLTRQLDDLDQKIDDLKVQMNDM